MKPFPLGPIINCLIVNENKVTPKNQKIVNKYNEKVLKLGYDERVIKSINKDCLDTVPYGY